MTKNVVNRRSGHAPPIRLQIRGQSRGMDRAVGTGRAWVWCWDCGEAWRGALISVGRRRFCAHKIFVYVPPLCYLFQKSVCNGQTVREATPCYEARRGFVVRSFSFFSTIVEVFSRCRIWYLRIPSLGEPCKDHEISAAASSGIS